VNAEALWVGGGVTLSELAEALPETLLAVVAGGIADHTVRNALTVGGNVCGRLAYREMALALLTLEAQVVLYGADGLVQHPMKDLFHKRLNLGAGELLLGFELDVSILSEARFMRQRRQKQSQTDYPIVHTVVVRRGDAYQAAVSGVSPYVWFGPETNALLKAGPGATPEENAAIILNRLEPLASSDARASAQYKLALLKADLVRFFTELESDEPEGTKATKEKGALK
jgi:CO/xanthine dehydrogenase FAD-binding subunit